MFINFQVSPDGKWIKLYVILGDPSDAENDECLWLTMYVVQEGDVFKTSEGEVIEHVKAGDILRIDWDTSNPYECDNSKLRYMYFPRTIASFEEKTGKIKKDYRNYDDLLASAVDNPRSCMRTGCYSCSPFMKKHERYDFQVSYISDLQAFSSAPEPPLSQYIDRL